MPSSDSPTAHAPRSKTSSFFVVGGIVSIPGTVLLIVSLGLFTGISAALLLWTFAIAWLFKKREEDAAWGGRSSSERE